MSNDPVESRTVWQGAASIVSALAIAFLLGIAFKLRSARASFEHFRPALPAISRTVTSTYWTWGAPFLGVVALIALFRMKPAARWPFIALAIVLALVCALTWYFVQTPMAELAAKIHSNLVAP